MNTTTTTFADTADAIVTDYQAADTTTKSRMRADMVSAIQSAVMAGDMDRAAVLVEAQSGMKSAPKERATVDYAARLADLHATLSHALLLVESGDVTYPEGVDPVDPATVDFDGGTIDPELARKLATVTGRKSGRGSVSDYIESVLGDEPMTIAELRAAWVASTDYPKAPPSAGAIGACLDRDNSDTFTATEVDGKRAATRA